jgi:hypothetical protein
MKKGLRGHINAKRIPFHDFLRQQRKPFLEG